MFGSKTNSEIKRTIKSNVLMNDLQYCYEIIQILLFFCAQYIFLWTVTSVIYAIFVHVTRNLLLIYNLRPQYIVLRVIHFAILAQSTTSTEMPILKESFLRNSSLRSLFCFTIYSFMAISVVEFQARGYKFTL